MKPHKPDARTRSAGKRALKNGIAASDADLSDDQLVSLDQTCALLGGCSRMHI
jgi:hypothetical protein